MNPRLAEIAPKLQKLMLMLSSDQPGEVKAAANAIERTLKAVGADWHDLAGAIAQPPAAQPAAQPKQQQQRYQQPQPNNWDDPDPRDWRMLYQHCREHLDVLSARELDFMDTLSRWRGRLTEKQFSWLVAIDTKLSVAGL
jgi:hypothetical protein